MKIKAIVAYTEKGRVIGDGDKMPWYFPEDFKHFKNTTINHPVIMGRKTWESLPEKFRPLPKRINYVISRKHKRPSEVLMGIPSTDPKVEPIRIGSLSGAFGDMARPEYFEEHLGAVPECYWIIGGETIYKQALEQNIIDEVLATEVKKEYDGDKFFPELKGNWASEVEFENDDFKIVRYKKVE